MELIIKPSLRMQWLCRALYAVACTAILVSSISIGWQSILLIILTYSYWVERNKLTGAHKGSVYKVTSLGPHWLLERPKSRIKADTLIPIFLSQWCLVWIFKAKKKHIPIVLMRDAVTQLQYRQMIQVLRFK